RDVPISWPTLRVLANKGIAEKGEKHRRKLDDGSVTQQRVWRTQKHKWERILDHIRVDAELMQAFSADPSADWYVVDVLPTGDSKRELGRAQDVLEAEIQAVAVAEQRMPEYPGTVLDRDNVSEVLGYIPDVDVLVSSPRLPRWPIALKIEDPTVLNPRPGDVFDVIEGVVGKESKDSERSSRPRRGIPDAQQRLWRWDPNVMTSDEVDFGTDGQTTFSMLG
ncbi:MAG: hypothetical protein ABEI86_03500, partial [Halobacteriaceae archaeon]